VQKEVEFSEVSMLLDLYV